jgi:uncharacterized membrane protein YgdD (TMEM256/DUF423 family)
LHDGRRPYRDANLRQSNMGDTRRAGIWLLLAGLVGAAAVTAGALGAHASAPGARALVETAAHYQLIHALALAVVALLARRRGGRLVDAAGVAFFAGSVLFGAGLYSAAAGLQQFTILTPFGGAGFIAGWLLLVAIGLRDGIQSRS